MIIASLRRSILKESMIFGAIAAALIVIILYVQGVMDSYTQQANSAMSAANQFVSERQTLEGKFTSVKENMPLFRESARYEFFPGLFIDSQAIRELFNEYQIRYFLRKLSVEMQPVTPVAEPNYVRNEFVATRSNIRLSIEGVSDADIYEMIRQMQKELPGFVKIKSFAIYRRADVTKDVLVQIRTEGAQPLVSADIDMEWYGMRSTVPDAGFNQYVPRKKGKAP